MCNLKMSGQSYHNNRLPCAKQAMDNNQPFYSYGLSTNNYQMEPFNVESCHKNQNFGMYTDWGDEAIKFPDKIEMIEITSKDLSPASYCSNLDLLVPDFYKNLGKDFTYYSKFEGQWLSGGYNTQKVSEYPSCAQSGSVLEDKTVKYCSIQKGQDYDFHGYGVGGYTQNTGQSYYNYYEGSKVSAPLQTPYFELPSDGFQPIDQQTEGSNDESDIIVEESEDEVAETGEKFPSECNRCVICNMSYSPLGPQFYYLTSQNPLTMSSQKPVFFKIVCIVGKITSEGNYLCSECLGLINTIDHLQFKLNNFNAELLAKFHKSNTNVVSKLPRKSKRSPIKKNTKFKCKLCNKILSVRKMCINHIKKHKFKGFLCELCGRISKTRSHFNHHQELHKKKLPMIKSFQCSSCPKSFRTSSNRTEHENYCLGLLPYHCKLCDKKFPCPTKLKNHVKLKHDKKFIAICSICNIGFVKYSDYKSHKISHSADKRFICNKCDKSYKTLSNLNFHMKIHNAQLPFICETCNKGFMRKEYLEAHVNNHKGIKNFTCSICHKKFVSQKNLDAHIKYHDGSTKTKTCNICGKVMTTGFEEHLRIHNNLREFECDQCDNKFNTKGTLTKHKKRKHFAE